MRQEAMPEFSFNSRGHKYTFNDGWGGRGRAEVFKLVMCLDTVNHSYSTLVPSKYTPCFFASQGLDKRGVAMVTTRIGLKDLCPSVDYLWWTQYGLFYASAVETIPAALSFIHFLYRITSTTTPSPEKYLEGLLKHTGMSISAVFSGFHQSGTMQGAFSSLYLNFWVNRMEG